MNRITTNDVREAVAHYVDTLERYGIAYDGRIGLDTGSPTYGRAWRLFLVPTGQTGHRNPPIGFAYLGWSAREAYESLTTRTRTMHDMAAALALPRHETERDRTLAAEYETQRGAMTARFLIATIAVNPRDTYPREQRVLVNLAHVRAVEETPAGAAVLHFDQGNAAPLVLVEHFDYLLELLDPAGWDVEPQ